MLFNKPFALESNNKLILTPMNPWTKQTDSMNNYQLVITFTKSQADIKGTWGPGSKHIQYVLQLPYILSVCQVCSWRDCLWSNLRNDSSEIKSKRSIWPQEAISRESRRRTKVAEAEKAQIPAFHCWTFGVRGRGFERALFYWIS